MPHEFIESKIHIFTRFFQNTGFNFYPGLGQNLKTLSGMRAITINSSHYNLFYSGFYNSFSARRGFTESGTWFKSNINSRALSGRFSAFYGIYFSMSLAVFHMIAFTYNTAIFDYYSAHHWIWMSIINTLQSKLNSLAHEEFICFFSSVFFHYLVVFLSLPPIWESRAKLCDYMVFIRRLVNRPLHTIFAPLRCFRSL